MTRIIDVYINALRKKVDRAGRTALIQTVRGVGYALRDGRETLEHPLATDPMVRGRASGDPGRLQRGRHLLMHHNMLALTDAALSEESADLAADVGRCRSPADFPRELGLRYASHEGYEFQVSTVEGMSLFRSNGVSHEGLPFIRPTSPPGRPVLTTLASGRLGHWRMASRRVPHPSDSHGRPGRRFADAQRPGAAAVVDGVAPDRPLGPGGRPRAEDTCSPARRSRPSIGWSPRHRRSPPPGWIGDSTHPIPRTNWAASRPHLNDMIVRLQRSFEEVRRFTADAAHELRTPLADDADRGRGRPALAALARTGRARARKPAGGDRTPDPPRFPVAVPLPRGHGHRRGRTSSPFALTSWCARWATTCRSRRARKEWS